MKRFLVLGAALFAGVAAGAQEPPPALPSSSFGASIDVRVVNVEAVVTDAKGDRVRGLAAGDFVLQVDGREVPIEYFSELESAKTVTPPARPGEAPQTAETPALAPEGRSILVFIDDVFATAQQRDRVLDGVERDLKLLGPADQMAIVAFVDLDNRVDVLSRWTGDRAALAAALQAARQRRAYGNRALADRRNLKVDAQIIREALALSDPDGDSGGGSSLFSGMAPVEPLDLPSISSAETLSGPTGSRLRKISNAAVASMYGLAPASGRRMMLVLSGGWSEPQADFPLVVAANRLGYTLYPVDVEGIDRAFAVNDVTNAAPERQSGFVSSDWKQRVNLGMELMAKLTGGREMLNGARLDALQRLVEDTGSYYWLGFGPQWKGDDRYHQIRVRMRRKDLAVRFRRGLSDLSRATQASLAAQASLLVAGEAKNQKLAIETGAPVREGSTLTLPVTVIIPTAELTAVQQQDGWLVQGSLAMSVIDKTGSSSDLVELPLKLTLPAKPGPNDHARYPATVKLRRIQQRLVATVRDPLGNAVLWGEVQVAP